ncbi:hypothetical protein OAI07_01760 [Akkermansiaceae bacterium]|nr:hypothetical protein [Akkermansiaceae bacterium]
MKHHLITLFLALASSSIFPAHVSAQVKTGLSEQSLNTLQRFSNLPKEDRVTFDQGLTKAQNLFTQKRIIDTLEKTYALDKIFPDHPTTLGLRAACYVELRNFEKAKAIYKDLLKFNPDSLSTAFNLAELEFVSSNWENADKQFSYLITKLDNKSSNIYRLSEFKILLSKIKLGQIAEAKAIRDKYDKWDTSPFYYYSHAALLSHEGKEKESVEMLKNCRLIWQDDAALASWQDTVKEFGSAPSTLSPSVPNP